MPRHATSILDETVYEKVNDQFIKCKVCNKHVVASYAKKHVLANSHKSKSTNIYSQPLIEKLELLITVIKSHVDYLKSN